ncbi:hypothetical protein HGRIS_013118 [Hohenbuehelia grisea]|uniref:Aprataxin C2HE/C2H2/C2HC zinc finger domain-containing protein n=1 Tax=Hohenbuehelia grisea TaxID=104357 RepID=A0ABR3IUN6_9AGAR
MPLPNLTILRTYAQKANPASLPASILFSHTERSLTIHDAYPKALFHFLTLPRIQDPFSASDLVDLRSLLQCDKARAKDLLVGLRDDVAAVVKEIEEEMVNRYGFKWDVWTGFHGAPSMVHLHIHIISSDLCSPTLKTKKHLNSFHPKHGFFLPFTEVLSWFDAEDSYFTTMAALKKSQYEPILKEDLTCWRCEGTFKNMPALKTHLQEEFDKLTSREKAKAERKRKLEQKSDLDSAAGEIHKKSKTSVSEDGAS